MACFIVPASEAFLVRIVSKVVERKLKRGDFTKDDIGYTRTCAFIKKRKWLTNMLWGGSALLTFEHVWHGEIVPWFPFLTAAYSREASIAMIKEMATVGVVMALVVSVVWIGMVVVSHHLENRITRSSSQKG